MMSTTNSTTGLIFSDEQLRESLRDVEDIFDRAVAPMILLKETARSLKETGELSGDKITVGITISQLTPEVRSTFVMYKPDIVETDKEFTYTSPQGMPIVITKIKQKYGFFAQPDITYYWGEDYKIPNPFDRYWKARFIVK